VSAPRDLTRKAGSIREITPGGTITTNAQLTLPAGIADGGNSKIRVRMLKPGN
jgi:hypothetical protein